MDIYYKLLLLMVFLVDHVCQLVIVFNDEKHFRYIKPVIWEKKVDVLYISIDIDNIKNV